GHEEERVATDRQYAKEDQRAAIAESRGELATAHIAHGLEEVAQAGVHADRDQRRHADAGDRMAGAELGLQIGGEERIPELLAQAEEEHGHQHDADRAIEREDRRQRHVWPWPSLPRPVLARARNRSMPSSIAGMSSGRCVSSRNSW